jgi:hypothetical protein
VIEVAGRILQSELEHQYLFQVLDNLPHLSTLYLYFKNVDQEISAFPKLLPCLTDVMVRWPDHKCLLDVDQAIEKLMLLFDKDSTVASDGGSSLWDSLHGLRDLEWLHLHSCSTSVLATLSQSRVTSAVVPVPVWNLTESGREAVAAVKDKRITFSSIECDSNTDGEEIEFWKTLPFVDFED